MKKIDIKGVITTITILLFQPLCYFIAKILQSNPTLIGNSLDNKIPFNTLFIIPYCAWYFLLFFIPYYFYKKDRKLYKEYNICYLSLIFISALIFTIYPTTVNRPEVIGNNILDIMTKIVFFCDTPVNCFPSIHVEVSMLFIFYILKIDTTKDKKILTIITSIIIIISTLFIKQHVIIDVIGGILLATIIYLIVNTIIKRVSHS